MNKKTINIKGMHCRSCEILIEDEIRKIPGIVTVNIDHRQSEAKIKFKGSDVNILTLSKAIKAAGYEIGKEEEKSFFSHNLNDYITIIFAALVIGILYLLGNEFGLFNLKLVSTSNLSSLPIVFLVGITAGISTCMALIGGLTLAISARFSEKHPNATLIQKFKPHLFFNFGRIISFFILGGIIGAFGSLFQLSTTILGLMTIAIGGVMLVLGLQLTSLFPKLSTYKLTLPKELSRFLGINEHKDKEYSHLNTFIAGVLTFFLPCGFTQAVQLYVISTGNALKGALTLGVFALGTAPGLLGIGGLTSSLKGAFSNIFFKFVGLIVIFLAIFNISNGYNLSGIKFSSQSNKAGNTIEVKDPNVTLENGIQVVKMIQNERGYSPNSFTIKKNIPVKWIITSENVNTCASSIFSQPIGIRKFLKQGENIIEFTPKETGEILFTCSMGMYRGTFNVVN